MIINYLQIAYDEDKWIIKFRFLQWKHAISHDFMFNETNLPHFVIASPSDARLRERALTHCVNENMPNIIH